MNKLKIINFVPLKKTINFLFSGFLMFLDYLEQRGDVYMVNFQQALDWVQAPTKRSDLRRNSGPLSCR